MSLHKEIKLEDEICEHLSASDWLYAENDTADYDRQLALIPADVLAWVQETEPKAWETLTKNHGAAAGQTLLSRLRDSLSQTAHSMSCGRDSMCWACVAKSRWRSSNQPWR